MKRRSSRGGGSAALRGLVLEGAEGGELTLGGDDPPDGLDAERPDQLVLEVRLADVEAEPLHARSREVGAEPGPFETAPEPGLLTGVAEAGEPEVEAGRAVVVEEPPDRRGTADGHDGDALRGEVPAPAPGERLDGELIADALDEHDRPRRAQVVRQNSSSPAAMASGSCAMRRWFASASVNDAAAGNHPARMSAPCWKRAALSVPLTLRTGTSRARRRRP